MKFFGKAFLFFLSATLANATVLFTDSFNYADGAITNVSGGVWTEHSGSGAVCLVVSGQAQVSSAAGEDVHSALIGQSFTTGALYASFTVKCVTLPNSAGSYFIHFNSSGTFRGRVWASTLNAGANKFRLGVGNSSGADASSGQWAADLITNTSYFVVIRYDVSTGLTTFWLAPTSESDPGVTASDATSSIAISNFSLREAAGIGTMLIDDLTVATTFAEAIATQSNVPPSIVTQPQDQIVTAGDTASFSVVADGTAPFAYQWLSNNIAIPGATNDTFALFSVSTNLNGTFYSVTITNNAGGTNSQAAMLTVNPSTAALTYLSYNVNGNGQTDWSTNAPQVQAVGRQLLYLKPDIITFNEIPRTNTYQMTNWVTAYMPGFYLATNSTSDGFIRSVIASRWPIARSQSWLSASNLSNFGYTNGSGSFTRDLFEAQINVAGFSQPLHVFVTHLKATTGGGQDDADRRAAEASCISNFFVNVFLAGTNKLHPYILSGDMNEDIFRPATNTYVTGQPIQRLISPPTGLQFTSPTNPFTGAPTNDMTESIRDTKLTVRFDYILPNPLMFSNIIGSQIFRTDKLSPLPPNLNSIDDKTASDHLPVLMVFKNPYQNPFQILSVTRSNLAVALNWESVPGQQYMVESSADLVSWAPFATNLMATNFSQTLNTNAPASVQFFRVRKVP
jgi:endonuclease/exonuclease/phosphatase family metal-dependent hydrolase